MATAEQAKPVQEITYPLQAAERTDLVPIFIMGKRYDVPSTLTIQKAFEFAGVPVDSGMRLSRRDLRRVRNGVPHAGKRQNQCGIGVPDRGQTEYVPDHDPVLSCQPSDL